MRSKPIVDTVLATEPTQPAWWQLPIVWMVIGGPAAVVVASLVTAGIAVRHIDPVLDTSHDTVSLHSKEAPAMLARNHASQTGAMPRPTDSTATQPADR